MSDMNVFFLVPYNSRCDIDDNEYETRSCAVSTECTQDGSIKKCLCPFRSSWHEEYEMCINDLGTVLNRTTF